MSPVSERALPEGASTVRLVGSPELGETMALYANFVQLSFTPHDFTFHFGWYALPAFTEAPPAGQTIDVPIRPLAKVSIPLNLVKAVIPLLERQIEQYELAFGPMPDQPTPPDPDALIADSSEEARR
jgi:hypothetical protein